MAADDEVSGRQPGHVRITPLPLEDLGVAELRDYIAQLHAEIARSEAAITRKQSHRSSADAFFRKP